MKILNKQLIACSLLIIINLFCTITKCDACPNPLYIYISGGDREIEAGSYIEFYTYTSAECGGPVVDWWFSGSGYSYYGETEYDYNYCLGLTFNTPGTYEITVYATNGTYEAYDSRTVYVTESAEPDIAIADWIKYTEVGIDTYVYAERDGGSPEIEEWYWDYDSGIEITYREDDPEEWSYVTVKAEAPGLYQVYAYGYIGEVYDSEWAYVCVIGPDYVNSDKEVVSVGESVTFTVETEPYGYAELLYKTWTENGIEIGSGYDASLVKSWSTPGQHTVVVHIGTGDYSTAEKTVTVVKVANVKLSGTSNYGPIYVEPGTSVYLQTELTPSGASYPSSEPSWSFDSKPSGSNPNLYYNSNHGHGSQTLNGLTLPGNYVVRAKYGSGGSDGDTITISVVNVDKIQYNNPVSGWTDVTGTLYVHKDDYIKFKAVPNPSDANWPTGTPVWKLSGSNYGDPCGVKDITFSTMSSNPTDYKVVSVQCGNTVDANVVVCVVEVNDISFNHDDCLSGHYDAITIRESNSVNITVPEWRKGIYNKPAAYLMGISYIDIKARFTITPAVSPTTTILADGDPNVLEVSGITFSSGISPNTRFTQAAGSLGRVDVNDVTWQWKVKHFGNGWGQININTSGPHKIYTILATPQAPMSVPWSQVLEKSCAWAKNMYTPETAAGKVVDAVFGSGYKYDDANGAPRYLDYIDDKYKLTTCLSDWGTSLSVNCWDCAQVVCIFSNSVGCNLGIRKIYKSGGFNLNYILPIGASSWTNEPFGLGRGGFSQHFTAWSQVYDACLQVDVDAPPTASPFTGQQPINMTFNAGTPSIPYDDYRGRLVAPADANSVTESAYTLASVK
jgi:hypothetical protein